MPSQSTIRRSPTQILYYPFDRSLRRAHRQFKGFPDIPYRQILDIGAHDGTFTGAAIRLLSPEKIWWWKRTLNWRIVSGSDFGTTRGVVSYMPRLQMSRAKSN
jgi:hypothetical protein